MTPTQLPAATLVPMSDLVHRMLGAATRGVSEGSRRNARAAIEARNDLTRHGVEVLDGFPQQASPRSAARRRPTA